VRLEGKVAIITGAARGIGRAIALGFAREGARVAIADIRLEQAQATAHDIQRLGGKALALGIDVSDLAQLDQMVAQTVERFGRIDILHNNAGIAAPHRDFFAYTSEEWDRVMNINLKSAFFASQKVAQLMVEQAQGGKILNTASTSAYVASTRPTVPYDISKAGLRQLTVSMAAHMAPYGITVNEIAPGTIDTELSANTDPAARAAWLEWLIREKIPLKRLGQPNDLVGAAIFLCSSEADYVTGHTLVVDGGHLVL
jgi:NAD(P)-dependent dehydrogenase (short-subunit alcohol dehydrogenase family)